jgi:hypothetical protein
MKTQTIHCDICKQAINPSKDQYFAFYFQAKIHWGLMPKDIKPIDFDEVCLPCLTEISNSLKSLLTKRAVVVKL